MKELSCRVCGKTIGFTSYDSIYDESCLCKECYEKEQEKEVYFTILMSPARVTLYCPHCHEHITLGDHDVD